MSVDLRIKPIGSEWVTSGGQRVKLLGYDGWNVMIQICDPHVIEGLTYPANARWVYTRHGSFIWSSGLHDRLSPVEREKSLVHGSNPRSLLWWTKTDPLSLLNCRKP